MNILNDIIKYNITFSFYKNNDLNFPGVFIRMNAPDYHYYFIKYLDERDINTCNDSNDFILMVLIDMIVHFKREMVHNGKAKRD